MEFLKKNGNNILTKNKFESYTEEQLEKLYSVLKVRLLNPPNFNSRYICSILETLGMIDKTLDKKFRRKSA